MQLGNLNSEKVMSSYNKRILNFFIRLFILCTAWVFCYALILRPGRIIDKPLTNFIASSVVKIINIVSPNTAPISWAENKKLSFAYLIQNEKSVFTIMDVCNGVDLMFIYIGVLVLLPHTVKRKFLFSIGGIIAIITANIIRVCSLYFIYVYYRSAFDFSHHYLFTLLMYLLIFYGWLLFIKNIGKV